MALLCATAFAQNAPDSPGTVKAREIHFLTLRTNWQDPPLRTTKQVFKSKLFWVGFATDLAAMSVACSHKNSGEECSSELPAVLAVQGFKYLTYRYMEAGYGPAMDGYLTGHYIWSATK